jgi:ATP-binding cassette subfamily B protein
MRRFPIVFQHDFMLCGSACLQMVCEYYKRKYTTEYLSRLCYATVEGVSMLGLRDTAMQLGFGTVLKSV